MSWTETDGHGRTITTAAPFDDCGDAHPVIPGLVCTNPLHGPDVSHEGSGVAWGVVNGNGVGRRLQADRRQEFREISSQDPAVVEAFGFGLFLVGARLGTADPDAGTDARAVELWRGSRPEDRAHWLHRAAGVIDAALSYVP